ncbi:META domain-containing protein [Methanoregula sp. PtaB.Bin085]|uniref:META domain-containing protein n=1 Tax=Methanoregula sp. PtaB.Bin085 TaxID=1811680 RepID=UPI0009D0388D|nr:META domain-containing protein [Methanoregula sp. PtaB.Bin085]OPX64614.1 MAG: META domain protein [Methanoregula sp. PtaB.Bin085]
MPVDPDGDLTESAAGRKTSLPADPPVKRKFSYYVSLILVSLLIMIAMFISFPAAKTNPGVRLMATNWTLESYTDETGILVPAGSGSTVTAEFSEKGRVVGNSGCNSYSFRYTTRGNTLETSLESVTDMKCRDSGTAQQESAFLKDMAAAASFRTGGSSLYIDDASGKTVLVFRAG